MVENVSLTDAMFCIGLEKHFFVVKNNKKSRCHSSAAWKKDKIAIKIDKFKKFKPIGKVFYKSFPASVVTKLR